MTQTHATEFQADICSDLPSTAVPSAYDRSSLSIWWEKSYGKQFRRFLHCTALHSVMGLLGSQLLSVPVPCFFFFLMLPFVLPPFPELFSPWNAFIIYPSSLQEAFSEWAGSDYMVLRSPPAPDSSQKDRWLIGTSCLASTYVVVDSLTIRDDSGNRP